MDLTILEGWGMVSLIIVSSLAGYGCGAAFKQFYEDRIEPAWLNVVSIVLATIGACGGTALAIYWAITNK